MQTNFEEVLRQDQAAILAEAVAPVALLGHYRLDGTDQAFRRIEALFDEVAEAVGHLDLDGLVAHAKQVALDRYRAGYDLSEVLAAFGTLEEVMRRRLAARLPASQRTLGLGLVGTALQHGKEAVGQTYAALQADQGFPDLTPLFRRSQPSERKLDPSEYVYPA
jgi:hypothetical protein